MIHDSYVFVATFSLYSIYSLCLWCDSSLPSLPVRWNWRKCKFSSQCKEPLQLLQRRLHQHLLTNCLLRPAQTKYPTYPHFIELILQGDLHSTYSFQYRWFLRKLHRNFRLKKVNSAVWDCKIWRRVSCEKVYGNFLSLKKPVPPLTHHPTTHAAAGAHHISCCYTLVSFWHIWVGFKS